MGVEARSEALASHLGHFYETIESLKFAFKNAILCLS